METTTPWSVGNADLYRRAGQELAADPSNHSAAGVILHGLFAEALYRWHTGSSAVSLDEVRMQLLDRGVAACAAEQVCAYRTMSTASWIGQQEQWLHQRVQELALDPPPVDRPEEAAYRAAATQLGMLAYGENVNLCYAVVAGAAAVARLQRLNHADVDGDIEDQIAAAAKTDPLLAVAWADMPDEHHSGPVQWVLTAWDEIVAAAEELAALTAAADTPATVEQRIAIARHEVTHGMLRGVRDTGDERLRQGYPAVRAYTEAVAEGLVRWEDSGGSPDGADQAMQAHADADPAVVASDLDRMLTPAARDKLREAIRDRWAQLAPPLPRN